MKRKPTKINLPIHDAERHIARIIDREGSGTVTRTAYTATLETPTRRYFFSEGSASVELFAAFQRLTTDIEQRQQAGRLWDEHADPGAVRYYRTPEPGTPLPQSCWSVDISAAYPTTARNIGLISDETFAAVMALRKPDRLRCLGMLASRKYIEHYTRRGMVAAPEVHESPLRRWYFDLCAYVGEVMENVRELVGPPHVLLYWVDGIYTDKPQRVRGALLREGYPAKVERIDNMRWSPDGKAIHYEREGKAAYLCIPQRHRINARTVLEQLKKIDE